MDRVLVTYTGDRASALKYTIKPHGKVYTAQGYMFGARKRQNRLLVSEAKVLADLDGTALDENGKTMHTVVGGKQVPLKNRDLVDTGGKPISADDTFEAELPVARKAKATTSKETKD